VVFCRGFIYETRFAKGSDKSDPYNMGVFHQPPSITLGFISILPNRPSDIVFTPLSYLLPYYTKFINLYVISFLL